MHVLYSCKHPRVAFLSRRGWLEDRAGPVFSDMGLEWAGKVQGFRLRLVPAFLPDPPLFPLHAGAGGAAATRAGRVPMPSTDKAAAPLHGQTGSCLQAGSRCSSNISPEQ
ncbi:hypothetical protein ABPG77_001805 [Micractinium sp. CCAP 211/92]